MSASRTDAPTRLVLVGWGAISQTVAGLLDPSMVEIVGVAVRDVAAKRPAMPASARLLSDPAELVSCRPDVVAEAAGRDSVEPWGKASAAAGVDFIVSSVSAFADADLLRLLRHDAIVGDSSVIIQPGALAGVEALAAAKLMGVDTVEHRIVKPPKAWLGTLGEDLCDLDSLSRPDAFYSANASETASAFPKNANVAMTTALAGIGPQATKITLVADPDATTNRHELKAKGPFGQMEVVIANSPLPANPKTSALAALSLARCITNRVAPIVI